MNGPHPRGGAEWASGWSAHGVLRLPERLVAIESARWVTWPGTGLQGRDLELSGLSGGLLSGQHVRATGADAGQGAWHCYDADFEFVYILAGLLVLETTDGGVQTLRRGSSFYHPKFFWHRDLHRSGDLEVVRLTSPASENRYEDDGATPRFDRELRASAIAAVYSDNTDPEDADPEDADPGPASGQPTTRDLGTWGPTEGRIEMRLVRVAKSGGAATRLVPQGQWLYVIDGGANWLGTQGTVVRLTSGCSLSMAIAGERGGHFASLTDDFTVLELCTGLA